MIEANNLTKRFGDFAAVDDLSLALAEGEILALLGPNGAGKTTTVRMLASILKPTHGTARVCGFDVVSQARAVRHAVGLLTEVPGLYLRMNAVEYLDFFGELQHMDRALCRKRADELLMRFGIWEARERRLGTYSKGMKQKAAIVRAMLHDPRMLFLDEPTSAMDPHSAKQVRDAISDLRGLGRTILLCTHNLPEAEMLADRIAIVRRGRVIASGTADQLKRDLLGEPLMEVRVAGALDGITGRLGALEVVAQGPDWFRYRTTTPQRANPAVLAQLAALGVPVVTLSEVERRLEDVYLKIVEQ
ncbi:MAG: ABC transporter ATP-binding protein [Chloroflexi bacterium]|nr:ABC transporter ATP-binding protein [Chloroflexota bacterium]